MLVTIWLLPCYHLVTILLLYQDYGLITSYILPCYYLTYWLFTVYCKYNIVKLVLCYHPVIVWLPSCYYQVTAFFSLKITLVLAMVLPDYHLSFFQFFLLHLLVPLGSGPLPYRPGGGVGWVVDKHCNMCTILVLYRRNSLVGGRCTLSCVHYLSNII